MPDLHERDDDAGVLADRAMAFRAHARIGEDLRDRVLRRRRLLGVVGRAERLDVVERVVVGDELQRVGDALDEVLLADRRSLAMLLRRCRRPVRVASRGACRGACGRRGSMMRSTAAIASADSRNVMWIIVW